MSLNIAMILKSILPLQRSVLNAVLDAGCWFLSHMQVVYCILSTNPYFPAWIAVIPINHLRKQGVINESLQIVPSVKQYWTSHILGAISLEFLMV